jgi:dolichol kinase
MVDAESVRKAIHMTYPIALIYYWLPPDAYVGVMKEYIVIAVLIAFFAIEAIRLVTKFKMPLIRDYEKSRIAAYALGSLGIGLGLLLFPLPVTAVAVCGMAWIDPMCHATKKSGGYPLIPLIAYLDLAVLIFLAANYEPLYCVFYGVVGAVVAIVAERPRIKFIDDDFVMTIVPLVVLGALNFGLGGLLP